MRILALVSSLILLSTAAAAQTEHHFAATRTTKLAHRSAFLHGYLHGYEQGFHDADLNLQMGRAVAPSDKPKTRKDELGYRHEFGDKRLFESGFRQGYDVGYSDSMAGRSFRAVDTVQEVTPRLAPDSAGAPSRDFDAGFSAGYLSGRHQGLSDARLDSPFALPPSPCPAHRQTGQEFCAAYTTGYRMGYSDGYVNQAKTAVAQAH